MGSPLPENESSRLEALRSLAILDSPAEQIFDDLARLTAYICGTPMALIGFLDSERLWFKSRVGWDVPEVPREKSFCAHTILQSDVLVISDTLEDQDRLAKCALATHGGIRFYAGATLTSSGGYSLGTLSVMDTIPRGLTAGQTDALRKLARQVVSLVELRSQESKHLASADSVQQGSGPSVEGSKVQGYSFWRDIAEQRRSREVLRHSEQRLHGIIGSAMDAIITTDSNYRIVVFNKAAEQIFRCPASEAIGQTIGKFIPERFRNVHQQHMQGFAGTGITARSMHSPATLCALRANGEEFPIEATISQVEAEGERLFTVILRDIGVRQRMEAELRQAQKMEAVGLLAGGVAHEFNNFLGVILGYTELLSQEAIAGEGTGRYVSEIKSATQHAASLTRQLLAFSRKQLLEPTVLDLNRVVWDSHSLLRRLLPANIDAVPVLSAEAEPIKADAGQLQQILINLVINARDAMPEGGKVVIKTARAELDEAYASQHVGVPAGSYVLLSITDSGTGMSEETRSHLFEPFYTTKGPEKGTGLGLPTVYGIVKQSGGHMSVESELGQGTTVYIYLPLVEHVVLPSEVPERPIVLQIQPTTILVVEDEPALRRLLSFSLERKHHKVYSAKDGEEAIEIFRQHIDQIQLVVTDLMMPYMDGFELKQHITALRPDVKFLFISGYAEEIVEQSQGSLEGCAFLEKPFLPEELSNTVSRLMSGDAAA